VYLTVKRYEVTIRLPPEIRGDLPVHRLRIALPLVGLIAGVARGWLAGAVAALLAESLYATAYLGREEDGAHLIKRYAVHFMYALKGDAPWRLRRFLDNAADRLLMRRLEGGYVFRHETLHRHLRDWDAGPWPFSDRR
jgi:hypothetical protein